MITKKEPKPERQSASLCAVCHTGSGTELISCDVCPKKFHAHCAAITPLYSQKSCAAHRCDKCHRPGSATVVAVRGKVRKNALPITTVELSRECLHCKRCFCKTCSELDVGVQEADWWLCHACAQRSNTLSTLINCVLSLSLIHISEPTRPY
eukprot:TRINITY_DN46044_c0_g1_i1.p2 TRINITY_DN46044_c0_g1~~TRINITY_DN46044_c0_g1_i1.p2  ORF type:complete len:152 (-),score=41.19 TRINITY_DN46044_c0_g1_i1:44-499(-)